MKFDVRLGGRTLRDGYNFLSTRRLSPRVIDNNAFQAGAKKESNFWILVIELSEQPTDLLVRSTNEFCLNQILLCIFFSSLRNKSDWIKWKAPGRIYPVLADPYVSTNISLSRGLFRNKTPSLILQKGGRGKKLENQSQIASPRRWRRNGIPAGWLFYY